MDKPPCFKSQVFPSDLDSILAGIDHMIEIK